MDHTSTHEQLSRTLTDRAEITDLINRYLHSLDERSFDDSWAQSMFTDGAEVEYPVGSRQGTADIVEITRQGIEQFDRTQHLGSNYIIELHGDRATVRCNAIMTHVHRVSTGQPPSTGSASLLTVGGHIDGEVMRTTDGWRFQHMAIRVVWATGEPPNETGPRVNR